MIYLHENRVEDPRNMGIEDNSAYLLVNSVGYYSIEDLRMGDLSTAFRRITRRDYLLCFVSESTMLVTLEDGEHDLIEGAMLFPPGSRIQYTDKKKEGPATMFWVHFTGYGADDILQQCGLKAPHIYETGPLNDTSWIFSRMLRELNMKLPGFELTTAGLLIFLFGLISRQNKNEARTDQRIQKVLDYLYSNYNQKFRIPDLAKIAGLSVSRFTVLFKENVGEFPIKFINTLRINKACELMKFSRLSIQQIALAVGFDDVFYFSRIFKKQMGVPPSRYVNKINPESVLLKEAAETASDEESKL